MKRSVVRTLLVSTLVVGTASRPTPSWADCSAPYFHPKIDFPVGASGPHGAVVGDFNEDGHLDLAVATTAGGVSVLLGQGGPAGSVGFAQAVSYAAGSNPTGVATGDFDEDGILDLAVANTTSNTVSILKGQGSSGVGNGTFAAAASFPAGPGPYRIVVGDFNEDGILDLAVANNKAAQVNVLIGLGLDGVGNGQFAPPVPYSIPNLSTSIASGDFNQDGITDLVATCNYSSSLAVLTGGGSGGVGNGTFLVAYSVPATAEPFVVAVADVNGDGLQDLIDGDGSNHGVGVMLQRRRRVRGRLDLQPESAVRRPRHRRLQRRRHPRRRGGRCGQCHRLGQPRQRIRRIWFAGGLSRGRDRIPPRGRTVQRRRRDRRRVLQLQREQCVRPARNLPGVVTTAATHGVGAEGHRRARRSERSGRPRIRHLAGQRLRRGRALRHSRLPRVAPHPRGDRRGAGAPLADQGDALGEPRSLDDRLLGVARGSASAEVRGVRLHRGHDAGFDGGQQPVHAVPRHRADERRGHVLYVERRQRLLGRQHPAGIGVIGGGPVGRLGRVAAVAAQSR
jgi:hypothetical protein